MALTEAELEAKRARADLLRGEIRSLRTDGTSARLESEREVTGQALDDEIARLEREVMVETRGAGGTIEQAMEAMKRAEDLEKMLISPKSEGESVEDAQGELEPASVSEVNTEGPSALDVTDRPAVTTENGGSQ